ncbi:MAG TPA: glycosyltransferase family 4 protein [Anaerolineae bacterium]|nr:glycosyltransferase family 4 protein [Anaerolineae bacterium]
MNIALILPGFSHHPDDWAIPALQAYATTLGHHHTLHLFSLRYPPAGTYPWPTFTHHATGGGAAGRLHSLRIIHQTLAAIYHQHRQTPFHLFHAFWADEPGLTALLAARLTRRPALISLGGGELTARPDLNYGTALSPLRRALVHLVLRHAIALTAGSPYQTDITRSAAPAATIHLAPLGINPATFPPTPPPPLDQPTLIQVASLTAIKNQHLLLDTLAIIKQTIPNIHLHLIGQGPLHQQLTTYAQQKNLTPNLTLHGPIPHPQLPRYYQQAHLYLQTSHHESQGVAPLEALATGRPLLGTPVGLLPTHAAAPTTTDPNTLATQAIHLLTNPTTYHQAHHTALTHAPRYHLPTTLQTFLDLYQQFENC